ncbi:hypothetical protein CC2G_014235 [Coprinopsis cinerea AmutBmut pab1-1]|nr:hypothetical protein CC2G_014235 [Coprinopsis cinerea AmutBmut pab1-1]
MPKRVQFAATNRVYSPIPTTPSPSVSSSSLPSSPDISTPPPEFEDDQSATYPRSPYPQPYELYAPEPVVETKEMEIHCCLAYGPFSEPQISHDLSLPPVFYHDQLDPPPLKEPATNPPLQYLTIICPEYLKWEIVVKASSPYPGSCVTVEDCLNAIYHDLRLPVNHLEYELLGPGKARVDAAYFARLNRIPDPQHREMEAAKGVKRIDFLMGRNRFMGLSLTHKGPDTWELNVS